VPDESEYEKIPDSILEQMTELHHLMKVNPEQAILHLLELYDEYPNVPKIQNLLSSTYAKIGNNEKADEMIVGIYQKYPNYLFGKCSYAALCLGRDEPEKIPEIFNNKYDLQSQYPHRKVFHVLEFVSFMGIMALYFIHTNNLNQAVAYYNQVKEVLPDSPILDNISYTFSKKILKATESL
jgi:tetratricopeptide (TPR) repeat protein